MTVGGGKEGERHGVAAGPSSKRRGRGILVLCLLSITLVNGQWQQGKYMSVTGAPLC